MNIPGFYFASGNNYLLCPEAEGYPPIGTIHEGELFYVVKEVKAQGSGPDCIPRHLVLETVTDQE